MNLPDNNLQRILESTQTKSGISFSMESDDETPRILIPAQSLDDLNDDEIERLGSENGLPYETFGKYYDSKADYIKALRRELVDKQSSFYNRITSRNLAETKEVLPGFSESIINSSMHTVIFGNGFSSLPIEIIESFGIVLDGKTMSTNPLITIIDLIPYEDVLIDLLTLRDQLGELFPFNKELINIQKILELQRLNFIRVIKNKFGYLPQPQNTEVKAKIGINCFGPTERFIDQQLQYLDSDGVLFITSAPALIVSQNPSLQITPLKDESGKEIASAIKKSVI